MTIPRSRVAAAAVGAVKYLAKAKCKKCGTRHRYTTSGQCVACTKARANARIDKIRSAVRAGRSSGGAQ